LRPDRTGRPRFAWRAGLALQAALTGRALRTYWPDDSSSCDVGPDLSDLGAHGAQALDDGVLAALQLGVHHFDCLAEQQRCLVPGEELVAVQDAFREGVPNAELGHARSGASSPVVCRHVAEREAWVAGARTEVGAAGGQVDPGEEPFD